MSDYQVRFWYALEMERRQEIYSETVRLRGGHAVETSAKALNDPDTFLQVVRDLGLLDPGADTRDIRQAHAALADERQNANYQTLDYYGDADAREEVVWDAVSKTDPGFRARRGPLFGPLGADWLCRLRSAP